MFSKFLSLKFCKFFSWSLEHHNLCSYHAHTLVQQCSSPFTMFLLLNKHLAHSSHYHHSIVAHFHSCTSAMNIPICTTLALRLIFVCVTITNTHHCHLQQLAKTRYIIECKKLYNNFTTIVNCSTCTCTPPLQHLV